MKSCLSMKMTLSYIQRLTMVKLNTLQYPLLDETILDSTYSVEPLKNDNEFEILRIRAVIFGSETI